MEKRKDKKQGREKHRVTKRQRQQAGRPRHNETVETDRRKESYKDENTKSVIESESKELEKRMSNERHNI